MSVTPQELERFHRFAQEQLGTDPPPQSLQECLDKWSAQREYDETVAAVREAEADIAAGRVMSVDECVSSIETELGLTSDVQ
ncbi:MAG: hypothetical protein R3C18_23815 [Planctomycetaceae bacterium]